MNSKQLTIGIAAVLAGLVMGKTQPALAQSASGSQQQIDSKVAGQLSVTVIERDGDGYRVRAQLQGASYDQTPAPAEDVVPQLSRPFYFTILPNGQMRSFYFAKGLSTDARVLLKNLATSMQAVLPASPSASWTTTEEDQTGQYQASYSANGDSITRTKTGYLQTNGLGGLMPMPQGMKLGVQSQTGYDLAPNGWAQHVTSNESYNAHFGQADISVVTSATLSLAREESRPDLVGPMPANVVSEQAANVQSAADAQRAQDLKVVAGRSFEDLLGELQSADKKTSDDGMIALVSDFRIRPDDLPKAEAAALQGLNERGLSRLIYTIGKAGTARAQATLVSLLQSHNLPVQDHAAVTLGLLDRPASASADGLVQALQDREQDVAQTALLAIGNMAKRASAAQAAGALNGNFPLAQADRLVGVLLKQLDAARDDVARDVAIGALGNTGDARTFAAVRPFLSDENPRLRASAVMALRFIQGAAADQAIIAALGDKDTDVRHAAASTIGTRPVAGVLPALTRLMKTEQNKQIAFTVLHGLNAKRSESPAVGALLQSVAQNQPQAQVKQLAQQMLATN